VALSVEESRLARRPPRKRREAAFTPRSETTIGTGLNSSKRDDIQTMDRHVFRVVVLRRYGTENRVKRLAVLSRIAAAAQFRGFGLGTGINPSDRQSGCFEGMGKNRLVCRSRINSAGSGVHPQFDLFDALGWAEIA
jgi:hypothetical protein